jgi:hypothetical protein
MPFDRDHMLFQWFGNIENDGGSNTSESFSGSLRFADAVSGTGFANTSLGLVDNDSAAAQVASKLQAAWTDQVSRIPVNFKLITWKWNRIGTDGKYKAETTREGSFTGPSTGGVGIAYPFHIALCTTYRTGITRGLAKSGRTYWPTAVAVEQNRGGANGTQAAAFGLRIATMLDSMGDWTGFDETFVRPVIMSQQRAGATRNITRVEVGDQFDVVNSRKISPENYQGFPVS